MVQELTTRKLQFRRALFIMLRYQTKGLSKGMLSSLGIESAIFDGLVAHQFLEFNHDSYQLTDKGIAMAQTIFVNLPSISVGQVDVRPVQGSIFISTVQFVGNDVQTYYLANVDGDETSNVDSAYFIDDTHWRDKKDILRQYDVKTVAHTKLMPFHQDSGNQKSVDYSSFFE